MTDDILPSISAAKMFGRTDDAKRPPPIFILGCHKSGTSLLRALLDGHRDLSVYPVETHFFRNLSLFNRYAFAGRSIITSPADLSEVFRTHVEARSAPASKFSDAPNFSGYSVSEFEKRFRPSAHESVAGVFRHYIECLSQSHLSAPPEFYPDRRIVEKSVENYEFYPIIRSVFPDAHFIHIVRNPYAVTSAIMGALDSPMFATRLVSAARVAATSLTTAYSYQVTQNNYLTVRFEDLVTSPDRTMQAVAEFLGIEFTEQLLLPGSADRPWLGNSVSQNATAEITTQPIDAWQERISPIELFVVNHFCRPAMEVWGYECLSHGSRCSLMLPAASETRLMYFYNRILLLAAVRLKLTP